MVFAILSFTDPLRKVRWFSQQLQRLFFSHYIPSQILTVDEGMVGFKGRSELKQYIPQKPTKWGYKIWCLVSDCYLLQFEIFEGRSVHPGCRSPTDIVLSLTSPYQHRNHIVYLDRYVTSPTLCDELTRRGFRAAIPFARTELIYLHRLRRWEAVCRKANASIGNEES